ncbi:MAG: Asp-tRNA(Asn)/Glu-tRNA(Gln) amidotransferase subunit GatB [Syntrophomonadaceae bacterium]|nr:Asp-tRNA(Asn)/Glu-tRNA(Gln) amidotransferase subunit GatB [Syntrophomonadaceae bacterium]
MDYQPVIGLEVHVELKTNSKIFCACSTQFGGEPNTSVCPVCLGLPGTLPVLNQRVVELATLAGLALGCQIASFSKFDRKNYYYPDLPKNYQISQSGLPIAFGGCLEIEVNGKKKAVGIARVHMEEDAGKLIHEGSHSFVDYNRSCVPLIEIVTEPDLRSAEEAKAYLEQLKLILQYIDVSDCKMEEGSLRCDANVSIMPVGSEKLGTKAEIKNMNSFRAVQRALEYEIKRQIDEIRSGGRIIQETRSWDENKGITFSMRSKEQAHDYRYFPDPDLVPLVIDGDWVGKMRQNLPELPQARRERLVRDYGLPDYDAGVITGSKALADFFDECVLLYPDAKTVSNWVMGELLRLLNSSNVEIQKAKISPHGLAELLKLIEIGTISGKLAKTIFEEIFASGKMPTEVIREKGLSQISDTGEIAAVVIKVLSANPSVVQDFKAGKEKALGFLVGQVMKETMGKANPAVVNQLLKERLR